MEMCIPNHGPPQAGSSCLCRQEGPTKVPFLTSDISYQPWGQSLQLGSSLAWPHSLCVPRDRHPAIITLSKCPATPWPAITEPLPGLLPAGLSRAPDTHICTLCLRPFWALCPSRWDGADIATVKWRKVVKLSCIRCAAVNLGWQEAHSGQFLCPVQKVMTFPDWKHDPMHLTDNCSHRLNCINLLSQKIKSSLVFFPLLN